MYNKSIVYTNLLQFDLETSTFLVTNHSWIPELSN